MNTIFALAYRRDSLKTWRCCAGMALFLCAAGLQAQSAPVSPQSAVSASAGHGFQLVQRVDDVLFGVDPISLGLIGGRYVSGTFVRVNVHQPSPVMGYTRFVADCQQPLRLAMSESASPTDDRGVAAAPLRLADLDFAALKMLDGSRLVAEFACGVSRQPGGASRLARALYQRGAPADVQSLLCDLPTRGTGELRRGVEIRYSESDDVVAVQQQWLSSGFLSGQEIVFGAPGAQWVIDRQTLASRLITASGQTLFSGVCERPLLRGTPAPAP